MMGNLYIAGWKTCNDWKKLKAQLVRTTSVELWGSAFDDYFVERLRGRYLNPINILQENGTFQGEGFSIVTIHCSIIEFLETTYRGLMYRYLRKGERLGSFEYNNSCEIFVSFLTCRKPFENYFSKNIAEDFYKNVRCGLLHEARTKEAWIIHAKSVNQIIAINPKEKIVFRDNFQKAFEDYLDYYKKELISNDERKEAFIRKFDSLCN